MGEVKNSKGDRAGEVASHVGMKQAEVNWLFSYVLSFTDGGVSRFGP